MVITVVIIKISNIFIGTTLIDGFKLVCMGCVCFTVTIVWHYDIVLDYWFRNFRFGTETYVLHRVSKTSLVWLAITLTHMNGFWFFFGRNVTDKVGNQKTLYCATSINLCFCTTCQNGETQKSHFHSIGLCYTHSAPVRCLPEGKNVICDVFDIV